MLLSNQHKLPESRRAWVSTLNEQIKDIRKVSAKRTSFEDWEVEPRQRSTAPKSFTEIGNYLSKSSIGTNDSIQSTFVSVVSSKHLTGKYVKNAQYHNLSNAELRMTEQEYLIARSRIPPHTESLFPSQEAYKKGLLGEVIHTYLIPGIIEKVNNRFYREIHRKMS